HARVDGTPRGPAVSALEDAAALGARVEGGGGLGVDGESEDSLVAQPRVDGAPALSAVRALKDAVAATSGCRVDRARVDRHGSLGVDGQGEDKSPRGED